jgi:ribosomal protein S18 acetylase RimI-like enzyme
VLLKNKDASATFNLFNVIILETIQLKQIFLPQLDELQKIGRQTFTETFAESNTKENLEAYLEESFNTAQLQSELSEPDSEFYMACDNGRTIGYLKINTGKAQTEMKLQNSLEVQRIYVLKEYFGKAVGQLLFKKAVQVAKEKKIDTIWLGVWEKNIRAIQFYKKNGFVEFDKHIFQLGDDLQTDLLMSVSIKDDQD